MWIHDDHGRALHAGTVLAMVLLATGCITADGTIRQDGTTTLILSYPTVATASDDAPARALVKAEGVTIETLAIRDAAAGERGPRRATATLQAETVDALARVPLFGMLGVSIARTGPDDGGGTLGITVLNPHPRKKDHPEVADFSKYTAVVRAHLPGTVTTTSGAERDGAVEWTVPAGEWSSGTTFELTASYAAAAGADTPAAPKGAAAGS